MGLLYVEAFEGRLCFLPIFYGSCLGGETDANFVDYALVCFIGRGVSFFLNLFEGFACRRIEFEFEDEHIGGGFYDAVGPPLALLFFGEHEVGGKEAEYKVERVVEVAFAFFLVVFPSHSVGY